MNGFTMIIVPPLFRVKPRQPHVTITADRRNNRGLSAYSLRLTGPGFIHYSADVRVQLIDCETAVSHPHDGHGSRTFDVDVAEPTQHPGEANFQIQIERHIFVLRPQHFRQ